MRIAFAADDSNATTEAVVEHLVSAGHEVLRVGGRGADPAVAAVTAMAEMAWPDLGAGVGRAVVEGRADLGVVMCWTGTGTAIAANKVPGVLAAVAWDPWVARGARLWNDANVLAMSLKRLAPDVAVEVLRAFLEVPSPDPQEAENIALLRGLDAGR
ncbi:RpiB/LacA/LacB family sugar-phosphate isomerase [Dactylosporangium sp. NPDC048998]|uniref:RpiB/LacA/LacB family sugar-phosphate isomerase n=1 Tax=Dactylosporangium sp. NPDC048998 TaxID=3363976 RepID=UPI0037152583